jgi:hypothetical protein
MAIGGTGFTDRKMHREMPRKELAFVPDDRRGRRICSGREILLDGERPVGCALLCSKSLRQRLAAPHWSRSVSGTGPDKSSDPQACRDAQSTPVSLHPIRALANKITNLVRARGWRERGSVIPPD